VGTVDEYMDQFEIVKSKLLLENRNFSEADFVDAFIIGLKDEIKPFVRAFKPATLEDAYEYATYVESATDSQLKRFKGLSKPSTNQH